MSGRKFFVFFIIGTLLLLTFAFGPLTYASSTQTIEAESGTLANGASVMNSSNASGGQAVGNLHNSNASCQMSGVDGGTGGTATLVITYSSNDAGASKGLFVNGTKVQTLNFSNTGGWNTYTTLTATITLNAGTGNTIMIKNDQANNYGINFDKLSVTSGSQTIEAESGTLANGASVMSSSNASGGQAVGNLHYSNASCQLNGVDGGTGGTATLVITYSSNDAGASKGLFVNGTKVQTLNFSNTGGWNTYTAMNVTITLNAGTGNTIMIKNDQANNYGINFDKITVSPTGGATSTPTPPPTPTPTPTPGPQSIEAESGALANGASVVSSSNASGGQAVGNLHNSNASCQVSGVDGGTGGAATLVITYSSNDSAASKGLFVNGARAQTLNFSYTGGWNTYTALTATIILNAGTGNTIMIKNDQANNYGINLDKFTITSTGGATPSPTPTPTATPAPPPSGSKLTWAPPTLAADAITYNVSGSGTFNVNPGGKDALIVMPHSTFTGQIHITNAHNVKMIGGEIQIRANVNGDDRAIYIDSGCNGIIHIEGVRIIAGSGHEGDAMAINAPDAIVQYENCRIENLVGAQNGHTHSDICQPWGGVGELRADRITGSSGYQGFFITRDLGNIGSVTLKNINIIGQTGLDNSGAYYLWTDSSGANGDSVYPLSIQNFWISPRPGRTLGDSVMPKINPDLDLSSVTWNTPNRTGTVYKGVPSGGDFVPSGVAGIDYVSPGYN